VIPERIHAFSVAVCATPISGKKRLEVSTDPRKDPTVEKNKSRPIFSPVLSESIISARSGSVWDARKTGRKKRSKEAHKIEKK